MFRKRVKKEYPAGTFIATPARVMAILQLCLVFTMICWQMSKPFMGDLYQVKSKMAVFDFVLKDKERFKLIPDEQRELFLGHYKVLQDQLSTPFVQKLILSFRSFGEMSPLLMVWMLLGTVVPILLLKKVEGAKQVIWLMPLLAAAYCFENRLFESPVVQTNEERLFPSESLIVTKYLDEPLSSDVFKQRDQLKAGWDRYLDREWGKGKGADEGLFAFNVERAFVVGSTIESGRHQQSIVVLALFLFWNLSLALVVRGSLVHQ